MSNGLTKKLHLFTGLVLWTLACAIMLALASSANADDAGDWTLTTADLSRHSVIPMQLDEHDLVVITDKGRQTIPLDHFVSLRRIDANMNAAIDDSRGNSASTKPSATNDFIVHLTNQDQLAGAPLRIDGERLAWQSPTLGTLELPLRQLSAIVRRGATPPDLGKPQTQDVAHLANGDKVAGIITAMTDQQLILSIAGESTPVPLDAVSSLTFASAGPSPDAPPRGFRLRLTDGSSFVAGDVQLNGGGISFSLNGDGTTGNARSSRSSHKLPLKDLSSLEQLNGPLVWLSSLTPVESIQIPQFTLTWPARMNRSVTGAPIRFANITYERGIGVHAYSRLRFAIPDGYQTFRTQYAIDGRGALADITARILLDDRVVYERKGIKAGGELVSPVVVPLNAAKAITLEVDYGQNGDTQDRFNWIEPALLRAAQTPAPKPSS